MPYPPTRIERALGAIVGLGVAAAGAWVLISPPLSYQGLGLMLTTAWGILLAAGGISITTGWTGSSYKIELPGIVLAMGGLAIYAILSWQATLTDSLGSGPRACLIAVGAVIAVLRLAKLIRTSRDARWVAEVSIE